MQPTLTRRSSGLIALLIAALAVSWLYLATVVGVPEASGARSESTQIATASDARPSRVLFINVQSGREDLHRVQMALSMARNQRAMGRPVTMFLNINAPELATNNLPTALRWRDNPPVKEQLAQLLTAGVKVLVCPTCSADQGVTAADLVPGAQMSNPTLLAPQIRPGTVTMTY